MIIVDKILCLLAKKESTEIETSSATTMYDHFSYNFKRRNKIEVYNTFTLTNIASSITSYGILI